MHISLDCSQKNFGRAFSVNFIHKGLKKVHWPFHDLRRLQDKGEKDFTFTKQLTHMTHGRDKHLVDNSKRLVALHKYRQDIF